MSNSNYNCNQRMTSSQVSVGSLKPDVSSLLVRDVVEEFLSRVEYCKVGDSGQLIDLCRLDVHEYMDFRWSVYCAFKNCRWLTLAERLTVVITICAKLNIPRRYRIVLLRDVADSFTNDLDVQATACAQCIDLSCELFCDVVEALLDRKCIRSLLGYVPGSNWEPPIFFYNRPIHLFADRYNVGTGFEFQAATAPSVRKRRPPEIVAPKVKVRHLNSDVQRIRTEYHPTMVGPYNYDEPVCDRVIANWRMPWYKDLDDYELFCELNKRSGGSYEWPFDVKGGFRFQAGLGLNNLASEVKSARESMFDCVKELRGDLATVLQSVAKIGSSINNNTATAADNIGDAGAFLKTGLTIGMSVYEFTLCVAVASCTLWLANKYGLLDNIVGLFVSVVAAVGLASMASPMIKFILGLLQVQWKDTFSFQAGLLSHFASHLVKEAVCEYIPMPGTMVRFIKDMPRSAYASATLREVLHDTLFELQDILNIFCEAFGYKAFNVIRSNAKLVDTWISDADEFISRVEARSSGVSMTDSREVNDLLARYTSIRKIVDVKSRFYSIIAHKNAQLLVYTSVIGALAGAKERTEPVFVLIHGLAGCGKSTIFQHLVRYVLAKFYHGTNFIKSTADLNGQIYQTCTDKFWNGWDNQAAVVCDDIFQVPADTQKSSDGETDAMKVIRMINCVQYPLLSAVAEDKGKKYFNAKLVVGSTNRERLSDEVHKTITNPGALLRRIHFGLKLMPGKDYCKEGMDPKSENALDLLKIVNGIKANGGKVTDDMFTIYEHNFFDVNTNPKVILYSELLEAIHSRMVSNQVTRNDLTSTIEDGLKEEFGFQAFSIVKQMTATYERLFTTGAVHPLLNMAVPPGAETVDSGGPPPSVSDVAAGIDADFVLPKGDSGLVSHPVLDSGGASDGTVRIPSCAKSFPKFMADDEFGIPIIDTYMEEVVSANAHWSDFLCGSAWKTVGILCSIAAAGVALFKIASYVVSEPAKDPLVAKFEAFVKERKLTAETLTYSNLRSFMQVVQPKLELQATEQAKAVLEKVLNNRCAIKVVGPDVNYVQLTGTFITSDVFMISGHLECVIQAFDDDVDVEIWSLGTGEMVARASKSVFLTKLRSGVSVPDTELRLFHLGVTRSHCDIRKFFVCDRDVSPGSVEGVSFLGHHNNAHGPEHRILGVPRVVYRSDVHSPVGYGTYKPTCRGHFVYSVGTKAGDCGALLFQTGVDPFQCRKILGVHYGATGDSNFGCLVTKERLEIALDALGAIPSPSVDSLVQAEFTFNCGMPSLLPLGRVHRGANTSTRSTLFLSRWGKAEPFGPHFKCPAILRPHGLLNPMKLAISKVGGPVLLLNRSRIRKVCFGVMSRHWDATIGSRRDILSFVQAVEGDPATGLNGIPRGTSCGYPLNIEGHRDKTTIFGDGGDYDFTTIASSKIESRVEKNIATIRTGMRPSGSDAFIWLDFLKDELLSSDKVDKGKARMISCAPLVYTIIFRMYFGDFMQSVQQSRVYNGIAIGMNPYKEWSDVASHLFSVGTDVIAGDFSGFDASEVPDVHDCILDYINAWYGDSCENQKIRSVLWCEVTNSLHLGGWGNYKDVLYFWSKSLPSGHPATGIINSMYNLILFGLCYEDLVGDIKGFWQDVRPIVLGDDNVVCISNKVVGRFNQLSITPCMSKYGVVYTDDQKTTCLAASRKLDEVSFLKRRFVYNDAVNKWLCPLECDSISFMGYYCRNAATEFSDVTMSVGGGLREASLHPIHYYEGYRETVRTEFPKIGYTVPPDFVIGFLEMRNSVLFDKSVFPWDYDTVYKI